MCCLTSARAGAVFMCCVLTRRTRSPVACAAARGRTVRCSPVSSNSILCKVGSARKLTVCRSARKAGELFHRRDGLLCLGATSRAFSASHAGAYAASLAAGCAHVAGKSRANRCRVGVDRRKASDVGAL